MKAKARRVGTTTPMRSLEGRQRLIATSMPAWSEWKELSIARTVADMSLDTVSARVSQRRPAINHAASRIETTMCLCALEQCSWFLSPVPSVSSPQSCWRNFLSKPSNLSCLPSSSSSVQASLSQLSLFMCVETCKVESIMLTEIPAVYTCHVDVHERVPG